MVTRRRAAALLLVLALCLPAAAADYYFRVDDLKATLAVRPDGTVALDYAVTFTPMPGSQPIDVVDLGMPNEGYDLATARASIAGEPLTDIRPSEYVKPGIEVHLDGDLIAPGDSGTLEFSILLTQMIHADSRDEGYASMQFRTTWFDRKYVAGSAGRIEIEFHLPPGTDAGNARYHDFGRDAYEPSEMRLEGDHLVYRWLWLDRPATAPYAAGASFPRRLVARVYSPPRRSIFRLLLRVVLAFVAFVFSLSPVWIIIVIIVLAVRSNRRRLQRYLPPRVGIESGGIKRGLTAPEAAMLRELSLPRVLLLVIFGLLKKERLEIREAAPKDYRFRGRPGGGGELQEYETAFLAAIGKDERLDSGRLRELFTGMIAALQKKMAGFSRRETNAYYQSIVNRAWDQVKSCPRETLPDALAESLEWLALDPEYEDKLEPYARDGVFLPGEGAPWYRHVPRPSSGGGGAVPGRGFGQTVAGAAGSLVQSLQIFSGALLGDGAAFTASVTRVTNPPPVPSSGGSSHGGSGCACACACACAGCACACAGGGR